jgi:hypothetical protein
MQRCTADVLFASGGGVRGGEAAPRSFLVDFGGEAAKINQKLRSGGHSQDIASAMQRCTADVLFASIPAYAGMEFGAAKPSREVFWGGCCGEAATTTPKLMCEAQPHDIAIALGSDSALMQI